MVKSKTANDLNLHTHINYICFEQEVIVCIFPTVTVFHQLNLKSGMMLSAGVIIHLHHII